MVFLNNYKANADLRGTSIWGERYQPLDITTPITLSQYDRKLLSTQASLIDGFREQRKGPVPRTEELMSFDALSREPEEIPLVNIEAEMVCFSVTNALTPLQILRERGKKVEETEALNLARLALDQVDSLQNEEDRVELFETLVKLNIRREELARKAGLEEN